MEDHELIDRCIQKDALAWNDFVKRYSSLVYWAIENRLKKWDYLYHPQDIEEIHQNVFLSLWKKNKLEQLKDQEKVSGWLVIISGNEAIDYFRYQKSQSPPNAISIFEEILVKDKAVALIDILSSEKQAPCREKELAEIENFLEEELNKLLPQEKIIIKLNILYNKKYREIADMLNMPIGSVATALKNIKIKLRKGLKEKIKDF